LTAAAIGPRRLRCLAAAVLVALVLSAAGGLAKPAAAAGSCPDAPSRRDAGDLIVLELCGSYPEMGRQQAELLGDDLRRAFEWQRARYARGLDHGGVGAQLLDAVGIPLWSGIGGRFEDSHFHEELAGIAAGLGVPRREVMRALLAVGAGSTVFAATRSATADGRALIGRNVDWDDQLGRLRPLVMRVRPTNGDQAHLFVGWPLSGLPTIGVNEAGFALSFNYFETDPQVGMLLPQWPHRRALQVARSVEEGIGIFTGARLRGIAAFMVMADAAGALAMVECTPARCAVFRPDGDWFGQANHARTAEMEPFDRYRSPDSFDRRAGIERAVEPHLGRLTPALAAAILRDRATHPWPNASNVGNLAVLNAVVVHPASRTLWHSTTMQPHAAFGAYEGFTLAEGAPPPAPLPSSPRLAGEAFARERAAIAGGRAALHALAGDRPRDASAELEALLAETPPVLDPARLAVGLALARLRAGDAGGASAALEPVLEERTSDEIRIAATSLGALAADRLGQRERAVALHREALALVEAHPEWNVFEAVAAQAREGIERPVGEREPAVSLFVLRLPL
jgi:hypothetical protein